MTLAIKAEGLVRTFGRTRALEGVDLEIPSGAMFGLLGPNGAGKTTIVRILATLLRQDAGSAAVAGFDVRREGEEVRARIGLTGQYAAVDDLLTGRENLEVIARLSRMPRADARQRALELLERFGLSGAGDRPVRGYSGGMRRRLDLAASLVGHPDVLFLDEPTTGLDPASRLALWDVIRELVAGGTTLLLTTQYLEEADRLANEIIVIDHGRVIAQGSAERLKQDVGGAVLRLRPADRANVATVARVVAGIVGSETHLDDRTATVSAPVGTDQTALTRAVRELAERDIDLAEVTLQRPSLDDVFLSLTGHSVAEQAPPQPSDPRAGSRS